VSRLSGGARAPAAAAARRLLLLLLPLLRQLLLLRLTPRACVHTGTLVAALSVGGARVAVRRGRSRSLGRAGMRYVMGATQRRVAGSTQHAALEKTADGVMHTAAGIVMHAPRRWKPQTELAAVCAATLRHDGIALHTPPPPARAVSAPAARVRRTVVTAPVCAATGATQLAAASLGRVRASAWCG
jgi:hypothetical protein